MFSLLTLKTKLLTVGAVVILVLASYYTGKLVGSISTETKVEIKELKSEIKGKVRDSEIDKEIDLMSDSELDVAYSNWVR